MSMGKTSDVHRPLRRENPTFRVLPAALVLDGILQHPELLLRSAVPGHNRYRVAMLVGVGPSAVERGYQTEATLSPARTPLSE
jgi:hypothetical protein